MTEEQMAHEDGKKAECCPVCDLRSEAAQLNTSLIFKEQQDCIRSNAARGMKRLMGTRSEPGSFSSRFLHQVLQLRLVRSLLKVLQKASVWVGFVVPLEAIISRVCPVQAPCRPTRFAKKRHGRLTRLLLAFIPTRIQAVLGHLPTNWGQSSKPKEVREALINPSSKANKRKRDDVALEEQVSWVVVLQKDLPDDDPEDPSYEPSEVDTDTEEYKSQNSTETDLELEEHDEAIMLKESDPQLDDAQPSGDGGNSEPLAMSSELEQENSAASRNAEDASSEDSGDSDTQTPQDVSSGDGSEQEADVEYESSSSSQCWVYGR
uniref:Uncharacterized LOC107325330 n=1 Tax=Coturnix japonica TaxID=93934 RepID=A0A8C2TC41_COTJA